MYLKSHRIKAWGVPDLKLCGWSHLSTAGEDSRSCWELEKVRSMGTGPQEERAALIPSR